MKNEIPLKIKTLQLDIIKRFMSEEQFNEFTKQYQSSRLAWRTSSRGDYLAIPLTEDEKNILKIYLRDVDTPITALERELNLKQGHMNHIVQRAALKCLYQNKDKISF